MYLLKSPEEKYLAIYPLAFNVTMIFITMQPGPQLIITYPSYGLMSQNFHSFIRDL